MRPAAIVLALVALAALAAAQFGSLPEQFVTVAPPAKVAVAAGKPGEAQFHFSVLKDYHINSSAPKSEYLIPTKLTLKPPTDLVVGKIGYPPGEELVLSFSKDKLSVYSGDFTVSAQISAARAATTGPRTIHGELKYQACNDKACFPPKSLPVTLQVEVRRPVRK